MQLSARNAENWFRRSKSTERAQAEAGLSQQYQAWLVIEILHNWSENYSNVEWAVQNKWILISDDN